jgi:hypothetical protein
MVASSPVRSGIFFISSNGSMATQWLATVLSAAPEIECFHGALRLLPEPNAKIDEVTHALQNRAHEKGIFAGIVHLSVHHGLDAANAVYNAKAAFIGLLRNPIEVVNSQFIAKAANSDSAKQWLSTKRHTFLNWLSLDDAVFGRATAMALKHYFDCGRMRPELLFLFETYTRDVGDIQRMLGVITGGKITASAEITKAFQETGVLNRHHDRRVTWEDIYFREWDDHKRAIFRRLYRDYAALIPEPELKFLSHYTFLRELCAA